MDAGNSFLRTSMDQVLPSALLNAGEWCGLPVVTHTGVAVGTIIIASVVEDTHGDSKLVTSVLTGVGLPDERIKSECGLGSAAREPGA